MKPDQINQDKRAREVFLRAVEIALPEARAAYLEGACQEDVVLRSRIEALLENHRRDSFLEDPAIDGPPTVISPTTISEGPGALIGRYKILEKIGEGGFGSVYVAEQREPVKRRVALKIIKLGMDTKHVVARFEAERQALALMDHPHIAKVLDGGATDTGRPYFVMELVRGVPITQYCDENNISTTDRLDLFIKACHAIQHAHQKGIIHRDIKPSNILVTVNDGAPVPKVIDFGIAKATQGELTDKTVYTQFQQFIGTPAYMSPEQADMTSLDIDTRSDIYALGVLLYELLTGRTPFDGKELLMSGLDEMRKTIREKEPVRPSTRLDSLVGEERTTAAKRRSADPAKLAAMLRGDVDWIVMKCLEKDRTRRYETANGLSDDLTRYLNNEPVLARPPSQLYRLQKLARRNKAASLATAGILAALAIGVGLAMTALVQKNTAQQRELDQSVRADTVTTFINVLLSDALPLMVRQGNSQGARELVSTTDRLATSSLSNAPAAEIELRLRLAWILGTEFNDFQAASRQAERIPGLLSKVSDDQLKVPREFMRIQVSTARLWAADGQRPAEEKAMQELDALYAEFMGRTPPAKYWAARCRRQQGHWLRLFRQHELAEEKLAAAYELLLGNGQEVGTEHYSVSAYYLEVLADLEKFTRAEEVARQNLRLPPGTDKATREAYLRLIEALANNLCKQGRFGEALRMLEEQRRVLADRGGSESELLKVDALGGEVLARSGNAGEALKVFVKVSSHPLSDVGSWGSAATLVLRQS